MIDRRSKGSQKKHPCLTSPHYFLPLKTALLASRAFLSLWAPVLTGLNDWRCGLTTNSGVEASRQLARIGSRNIIRGAQRQRYFCTKPILTSLLTRRTKTSQIRGRDACSLHPRSRMSGARRVSAILHFQILKILTTSRASRQLLFSPYVKLMCRRL
jgi:hypothetical protein